MAPGGEGRGPRWLPGPDHGGPKRFSASSVPDAFGGPEMVRHLYEHHHTVIAGARNRLAGRVIRIGTMGAVTEGDILTDLLHLEETLRALGQTVAGGAGVAAAASVLAEPALSRA